MPKQKKINEATPISASIPPETLNKISKKAKEQKQELTGQRPSYINPYPIGVLLIIGVFVILVLMMFVDIPEPSRSVFYALVGTLVSSVGTIVGFYFGSSQSSQSKNKTISNILGGK